MTDTHRPPDRGHEHPSHEHHEDRPHLFHLLIDQKPHPWPKSQITGLHIKELAGITDPDFGVWRVEPGPKDDEPVEDNQTVELFDEVARNRFITGPVKTTEG